MSTTAMCHASCLMGTSTSTDGGHVDKGYSKPQSPTPPFPLSDFNLLDGACQLL